MPPSTHLNLAAMKQYDTATENFTFGFTILCTYIVSSSTTLYKLLGPLFRCVQICSSEQETRTIRSAWKSLTMHEGRNTLKTVKEIEQYVKPYTDSLPLNKDIHNL